MALFGTAHLGMRRVVTPWGSVVGDARHWHHQPFCGIPKQLQWQFLESLYEGKFVIQLEALHIKDRFPLEMYSWLPIHVELPAELPVLHTHYARLPTIANNMHQAYEQINKVLQGHWEPMIICQYRCHSIKHVNAKCFSLRQKLETVHIILCAIESTGHHDDACSLQPMGFWMKWKCFHEIMTGMGNPFLTTDNKLITLYTRGACISCVLFPNLWSWPSHPRNITTPPSDTTIRHN